MILNLRIYFSEVSIFTTYALGIGIKCVAFLHFIYRNIFFPSHIGEKNILRVNIFWEYRFWLECENLFLRSMDY